MPEDPQQQGGWTLDKLDSVLGTKSTSGAPTIASAAPPPDLGVGTAPSLGPKPDSIFNLADYYADKYGVDKAIVRRMVKQESGGNRNAISPKGAIGAMQLMPGTAKMLGVDPNIPEQNVEGGVRHLSTLVKRYNGDYSKGVAAYHAGTGAVDAAGGIPDTNDGLMATKDYVAAILGQQPQAAGAAPAQPQQGTLWTLDDLDSQLFQQAHRPTAEIRERKNDWLTFAKGFVPFSGTSLTEGINALPSVADINLVPGGQRPVQVGHVVSQLETLINSPIQFVKNEEEINNPKYRRQKSIEAGRLGAVGRASSTLAEAAADLVSSPMSWIFAGGGLNVGRELLGEGLMKGGLSARTAAKVSNFAQTAAQLGFTKDMLYGTYVGGKQAVQQWQDGDIPGAIETIAQTIPTAVFGGMMTHSLFGEPGRLKAQGILDRESVNRYGKPWGSLDRDQRVELAYNISKDPGEGLVKLERMVEAGLPQPTEVERNAMYEHARGALEQMSGIPDLFKGLPVNKEAAPTVALEPPPVERGAGLPIVPETEALVGEPRTAAERNETDIQQQLVGEPMTRAEREAIREEQSKKDALQMLQEEREREQESQLKVTDRRRVQLEPEAPAPEVPVTPREGEVAGARTVDTRRVPNPVGTLKVYQDNLKTLDNELEPVAQENMHENADAMARSLREQKSGGRPLSSEQRDFMKLWEQRQQVRARIATMNQQMLRVIPGEAPAAEVPSSGEALPTAVGQAPQPQLHEMPFEHLATQFHAVEPNSPEAQNLMIEMARRVRSEQLAKAEETAAKPRGEVVNPDKEDSTQTPTPEKLRARAKAQERQTFIVSEERGSQALEHLRSFFAEEPKGPLYQADFAGGPGQFNPLVWKSLLDYGLYQYERGAKDFGKWSEIMAKAVGEGVRPHLQMVHQAVESVFHEETQQRQAALSPQAIETRTQQGVQAKKLDEVSKTLTKAAQSAKTPGEAEDLAMQAEEAKRRSDEIRKKQAEARAAAQAAKKESQFQPVGQTIPMQQGKETEIIVPGKERIKAHYAVVSLRDLIPSHVPYTWESNDNAFQPRKGYGTSIEVQQKVLNDGRNVEPERIINTNPDAVNGPPIVRRDGLVAGGNGRTMIQWVAYKEGRGPKIYQMLQREAATFGIDPKSIPPDTDWPVLVRVMDSAPVDRVKMELLGDDLNIDPQKGYSEAERAAASSKRMNDADFGWVASELADRDWSVRDLMRERQSEAIDMMLRTGMIPPTRTAEFIDFDPETKTKRLTEAGKNLLEGAVFGRVLRDPVLYEDARRTIPSVLNKLGRALAPLARIAARSDVWDISDYVDQALRLRMRMESVKEEYTDTRSAIARHNKETDKKVPVPTSFVDWYLHPEKYSLTSGELTFGDEGTVRDRNVHPIVESLAELLEDDSSVVKEAFTSYAKAAERSDEKNQGGFDFAKPQDPWGAFNSTIGKASGLRVGEDDWGQVVPATPKAGEGNAAPLKSGVNGVPGDTQRIGDLLNSDAFGQHGLRGLDIPSQREVMSHVLTAIHDPEVRDFIVQFVPVDVVDNLVRLKLPAEVSLHDKNVLFKSHAPDLEGPVSIGIDTADALATAEAKRIAVLSGRPSEVTGVALDKSPAVTASDEHGGNVPQKPVPEWPAEYKNAPQNLTSEGGAGSNYTSGQLEAYKKSLVDRGLMEPAPESSNLRPESSNAALEPAPTKRANRHEAVTQDEIIHGALHSTQDADKRWAKLREKGATDAQLKEFLKGEMGQGGYTAVGSMVDYNGNVPEVRIAGGENEDFATKKVIKGAQLIKEVRRIMEIPEVVKGETPKAALTPAPKEGAKRPAKKVAEKKTEPVLEAAPEQEPTGVTPQDIADSIKDGEGNASLIDWAGDSKDPKKAIEAHRAGMEADGWKWNPKEKQLEKDGWYAWYRSQGELSSPILQWNKIEEKAPALEAAPSTGLPKISTASVDLAEKTQQTLAKFIAEKKGPGWDGGTLVATDGTHLVVRLTKDGYEPLAWFGQTGPGNISTTEFAQSAMTTGPVTKTINLLAKEGEAPDPEAAKRALQERINPKRAAKREAAALEPAPTGTPEKKNDAKARAKEISRLHSQIKDIPGDIEEVKGQMETVADFLKRDGKYDENWWDGYHREFGGGYEDMTDEMDATDKAAIKAMKSDPSAWKEITPGFAGAKKGEKIRTKLLPSEKQFLEETKEALQGDLENIQAALPEYQKKLAELKAVGPLPEDVAKKHGLDVNGEPIKQALEPAPKAEAPLEPAPSKQGAKQEVAPEEGEEDATPVGRNSMKMPEGATIPEKKFEPSQGIGSIPEAYKYSGTTAGIDGTRVFWFADKDGNRYWVDQQHATSPESVEKNKHLVEASFKPKEVSEKTVDKLRKQVKEAFPNVTDEQFDAMTQVWAMRAKARGMELDKWLEKRIKSIQKGLPGTQEDIDKTLLQKMSPEQEHVIRTAGLEPLGVQDFKDVGLDVQLAYLQDPITGSSMALPLKDLTPEAVAEKIAKFREEYKAAATAAGKALFQGNGSDENGLRVYQDHGDMWMSKAIEAANDKLPDRIKVQESKQLPDKTIPAHEVGGRLIPERTIKGVKTPERGVAEQVLTTLANAGVTKDEIKWTGLADFLADKKEVKKQDLLQFLHENRVSVEDVHKQRGNVRMPSEIAQDIHRLGYGIDVYGREPGEFDVLDSKGKVVPEGQDGNIPERVRDLLGEYTESRAYATGDSAVFGAIQEHPRYDRPDLRIPGPHSGYHELLLTLPLERGAIARDRARFQELSDKAEAVERKGSKLSEAEFKEMTELGQRLANKRNPYLGKDANSQMFRDSHWEEPNVLAHVRFTDRRDAEGKRVLMVEEVQSDWHQKGKRLGYAMPEGERDAAQQKMTVEFRHWLIDNKLPQWSADDLLRAEGRVPLTKEQTKYLTEFEQKWNEIESQRNKVPAAPFAQNWHELAMKRVLRYAAEHGYDRVAWTTGEQQKSRYNLSNYVDEITYDRHGNLVGYKDGEPVVTHLGTKPEELEGYVGKDLAKQLLEDREASTATPWALVDESSGQIVDRYKTEAEAKEEMANFAGGYKVERHPGVGLVQPENFKMGGDWAEKLYDNAIPNFMRQYGKRWGAKVGEANINPDRYAVVEDGMGNFRIINERQESIGRPFQKESSAKARLAELEKEDTVHSIDVTPEMRQAVMRGQYLWQDMSQGNKGGVMFNEDGRAIIGAFESGDVSTLLHETFHVFRRDLTKPELKAAEKAFGVEDGIWTRDAEEKFARAGERYFYDGEAPVPALKAVFDKFKVWLRNIYQTLIGSPIQQRLTDPQKALFERILGVEREKVGEKPLPKEAVKEAKVETLQRAIEAREQPVAPKTEAPEAALEPAPSAAPARRAPEPTELEKRLASRRNEERPALEPAPVARGPKEAMVRDAVERAKTTVFSESDYRTALDRAKQILHGDKRSNLLFQASPEAEGLSRALKYGDAYAELISLRQRLDKAMPGQVDWLENKIEEQRAKIAELEKGMLFKKHEINVLFQRSNEPATYKGRPFFAGAVDPLDGEIEAVVDHRAAAAFRHGGYFPPELTDRINRGELATFVVDPHGEVRIHRAVDRGIPEMGLLAKIKDQIQVKSPSVLYQEKPNPLMDALRTIGGYHLESGVKSYDKWREAMDRDLGDVPPNVDYRGLFKELRSHAIERAQNMLLREKDPDKQVLLSRALRDFQKLPTKFQFTESRPALGLSLEPAPKSSSGLIVPVSFERDPDVAKRIIRDAPSPLEPPPPLGVENGTRKVAGQGAPPSDRQRTGDNAGAGVQIPGRTGSSPASGSNGAGQESAGAGSPPADLVGRGTKEAGPKSGPGARRAIPDIPDNRLSAPRRPAGPPVYTEESWRNRLRALNLPENAPVPSHRLSPEISKKLIFPGQPEVADVLYSGLQQHDGVVAATSTGTGKTYLANAILKQMVQDGAADTTLYVTKNRKLVHDTIKTAKEVFGLDLKELPSGEEAPGKGLWVTTYKTLGGRPGLRAHPFDFLIADESGEARRWYTNAQGEALTAAADSSKKAMFMSATPFHTPLETGYLGKLGMWHDEGFDQWVSQFGTRKTKDGNWVAPLNPRKMAKLREQLIERGQFLNWDRNMEGYQAHFGMVKMTPEVQQGLNNAMKAFEVAERYFQLQGRKDMVMATRGNAATFAKNYVERSRLPQAIEVTKRLEKAGWKVLLFSENKREVDEIYDFLKPADKGTRGEISRLLPKLPGVVETLQEALGDNLANYSGAHSAGREAQLEDFRTGRKDHLFATYGAGGVGVSLHDADFTNVEGNKVQGGNAPRAVVYLGLPWSGVMFDQAIGRPWRFGTKSDVHAIFLTSDAAPEMELIAKKVAPRLSALRAGISGLDVNDPVIRSMQSIDSYLDYEQGGKQAVDATDYKNRHATSGITAWDKLPLRNASEAMGEGKGMRVPDSDLELEHMPGREPKQAIQTPEEYRKTTGKNPPNVLYQEDHNKRAIDLARMIQQKYGLQDKFGLEAPPSAKKADEPPAVKEVQRNIAEGPIAKMAPAARDAALDNIAAQAQNDVQYQGAVDPTPTVLGRWKSATEWLADSAVGKAAEGPLLWGLTSGREIIRREGGKMGNSIVGDILNYHVRRDNIAGPWTQRLHDIVKDNKLTNPEFAQVWDHIEEGTRPKDPRLQRALDGVQKLKYEAQDEATRVGMMTEFVDENGNRNYVPFPSERDPNYMPHRFSEEMREFFQKMREGKLKESEAVDQLMKQFKLSKEDAQLVAMRDRIIASKRDKIVQDLMERNGINRAQAEILIEHMRRGTPLAANLEKARQINLPGYRKDVGAFAAYLEDAAEGVARTELFGQKREFLMGKLAQIEDPRAIRRINRIMDGLLAKNMEAPTARNFRNFAADWTILTKLAFSAIPNMSQGANAAFPTNSRAMIRGLFHTIGDYKGSLRAALDAGAILEQTHAEMLREFGAKGKLAERFLRGVGFLDADTFSRAWTVATTRIYMDRYALPKIADGGEGSKFYRRNLVDNFRLSPEAVDAAVKRGSWSTDDYRRASAAVSNETQFTFDPTELPPVWRGKGADEESQMARAFIQTSTLLKSYAFKQGVLVKKYLIQEAKKGNFRPWIPFIALFPVIGEVVGDLSKAVRGDTSRLEQLLDLGEANMDALAGDRDPLAVMAADLHRVAENIGYVGGIGLATSVIDSLKWHRNLGEFLLGPFYTDLARLGTGAYSVFEAIVGDGKNHREDPGERIVRAVRRTTETTVSPTKPLFAAGEKAGLLPETKTRQAPNTLGLEPPPGR